MKALFHIFCQFWLPTSCLPFWKPGFQTWHLVRTILPSPQSQERASTLVIIQMYLALFKCKLDLQTQKTELKPICQQVSHISHTMLLNAFDLLISPSLLYFVFKILFPILIRICALAIITVGYCVIPVPFLK